MSTVLRVKRRAEETPHEALVLLSKRLKTESTIGGDLDLALNVFVFSGTVTDKETLETHLKHALSKHNDRLQELNPLKNAEEILKKLRQERKQASLAGRYEILNLNRGLKKTSKDDYSVVDIAKNTEKEGKDVEYAYDLYLSQKKDFDVSTLDNVVRIENLEMELMFGSYRDNGRKTPSDRSSLSSEDSNDENNWRNDYPDTEPSSVDEEDMRKAMEDIDIGNELSSDADEEEIYNEPSIDLNDLNRDDIERYGIAYAKYKSRVLDTTNTLEENNLKTSIQNQNTVSNYTAKITKVDNIEDKNNLVFCSKVEDSDESSEGYKDSKDGFYYGMEEDDDQLVGQYRQDESDEDFPD